ncbi:type II toxin-antitoxin system HicB family antitoxin [Pantoea eucrina]|uniref:type II toxin-antitoxin system HicB family antitoxin n=1 Tax=Pantoea eucrina TaxID=472693 RepID=UPI0024B77AA9|nr:type II toxin-antitoxin system HicB family antitoxin [Pantoea eucrina]MDJ0023633.1 type II toxin-antitoxin system HicB family antitoxin [Pantoea eucrina]
MFVYPVRLVQNTSASVYAIACRDLPFVHATGDTADKTLQNASEAVILAISVVMGERRMVPTGSKVQRGEHLVSIPVLVAMKVVLHNMMIEKGMRKADLGRSLNLKNPQIERLLDLHHPSKVELVEKAIHQLGRAIRLTAVEVYAPNRSA